MTLKIVNALMKHDATPGPRLVGDGVRGHVAKACGTVPDLTCR